MARHVVVGGFEVFREVLFFLQPSRERVTVYFSRIYTNIRAVLQRSAEVNELECGRSSSALMETVFVEVIGHLPHSRRDQCIVARVRRFGAKVAASFVSHATAPGVRCHAAPHSVT